jgi:hypothetical protein
VRELLRRIDHFVIHHNVDCKLLIWAAAADSIIAKLERLCARITGTAHPQATEDLQPLRRGASLAVALPSTCQITRDGA